MKKLIIFMGPSGAGKHELANYYKSKNDSAIIVDKREIEANSSNKTLKEQKQIFYNTINKMLSIGNTIIIISHCVLQKDRKELFDNLNLNDIKIIGIWIENNWQNIKFNNENKEEKYKIPKETLKFIFNYRSSPTKEEPFDDLVYLIMPENIGMSKSYPYIDTIFNTLDKI